MTWTLGSAFEPVDPESQDDSDGPVVIRNKRDTFVELAAAILCQAIEDAVGEELICCAKPEEEVYWRDKARFFLTTDVSKFAQWRRMLCEFAGVQEEALKGVVK